MNQYNVLMRMHLSRLCKKQHFTMIEIRSHRRTQDLVDARRSIAKDLHKMGFNFTEIGRVMNRDHTSILYHVKDKFRQRKNSR